jgi:hypothetical protein
MQTFPENHPNDPEPILVALEVGRAMWGRGDTRGAMKWLRQAIDEAFDSGFDERGLDLSKQAATLASDPSILPPRSADDDFVDLELPTRSSNVPTVSLRAATGRFAALRERTNPPSPREGVAGAAPVVDETASTSASIRPAPLARVALKQTPLSMTPAPMPVRSVPPPPPAEAIARAALPPTVITTQRPRTWGATTALRVALRSVGGEVKARRLAEGETATEGEVEATVLAPGADRELRELFPERLDATGSGCG